MTTVAKSRGALLISCVFMMSFGLVTSQSSKESSSPSETSNKKSVEDFDFFASPDSKFFEKFSTFDMGSFEDPRTSPADTPDYESRQSKTSRSLSAEQPNLNVFATSSEDSSRSSNSPVTGADSVGASSNEFPTSSEDSPNSQQRSLATSPIVVANPNYSQTQSHQLDDPRASNFNNPDKFPRFPPRRYQRYHPQPIPVITSYQPIIASLTRPRAVAVPQPAATIARSYAPSFTSSYNKFLDNLQVTPQSRKPGNLLSSNEFPGYFQAIDAPQQPLVFSSETGLQLTGLEPGFGVSFDFAKPPPPPAPGAPAPRVNQPFRPNNLLAVQSPNGSPQFPQYRGASVAPYQQQRVGIPNNNYQDFRDQRQLHFGNGENSAQRGRAGEQKSRKKGQKDEDEDAEQENENDDESGEAENRSSENDDEESSEPRGGKNYENGFQPSKSFSFRGYDEESREDEDNEKRGRSSKYQRSRDDDDDSEDDHRRHNEDEVTEEEDDDEGGNGRPKSTRSYRNSGSSNSDRRPKHNKRDRAPKQPRNNNRGNNDKKRSKSGDDYDFDVEFEQSFRKRTPRNRPSRTKSSDSENKSQTANSGRPRSGSLKPRTHSLDAHEYSKPRPRKYRESSELMTMVHNKTPRQLLFPSPPLIGSGLQKFDDFKDAPNNNRPRTVHQDSYGLKVPSVEKMSVFRTNSTQMRFPGRQQSSRSLFDNDDSSFFDADRRGSGDGSAGKRKSGNGDPRRPGKFSDFVEIEKNIAAAQRPSPGSLQGI